jgi:hypothetical protein
MGHCILLLSVLTIAPTVSPPPSPEENILQKAGVAVDGDGLLALFRGRTLNEEERKQIGQLIRRLGADDFNDREQALEALRKIGGRALPLVRAAQQDIDPEIAHRTERLVKEVEPLPLKPAIAAARLLARRAPADAVPVLLAYLPFAGDEAVEDEVRAALAALTPDGKAEPALIAALDDPLAVKRAAAAYVLARKGDKDQRDAVRKLLEDKDAPVRWQAAAGLLAVHDRTAVPTLTALLADGPFDTAWRAEELLRRLAGDKAPAIWLSDAPETRVQCRDAWAAWWKKNGERVDLAHYEAPARLLGYTLGVEYNTGRVWECDIDGSIRWEIRDLAGPMDAQVLPNGHVLIAEADAHRITERDFKGAVLWEKKIEGKPTRNNDGGPNGCQRLPDGHTFVSTPPRAMEFAADGTMVYSFNIETSVQATNSIRKAGNGRIYFTAASGICEADASGKIPGPDIKLPGGRVLYVGIEDLPGGRFLVADSRGGHVLEVGATGAILWQADVPSACGVERLPNGHTLVGANHKVLELGVDGKPVWEKTVEGYVRRAYRR